MMVYTISAMYTPFKFGVSFFFLYKKKIIILLFSKDVLHLSIMTVNTSIFLQNNLMDKLFWFPQKY